MPDSQSLVPAKVILENEKEYECISRSQLIQWKTEGRIPENARILFKSGESMMASEIDWPSDVGGRQTPPTRSEDMAPVVEEAGALGHLIPAKNSLALTAYYLGVFSAIPIFGVTFGIAAIIMGILGIKKSRTPEVGVGFWHGVVAIILGSIFTLIWSAAIAGMIYQMIVMP